MPHTTCNFITSSPQRKPFLSTSRPPSVLPLAGSPGTCVPLALPDPKSSLALTCPGEQCQGASSARGRAVPGGGRLPGRASEDGPCRGEADPLAATPSSPPVGKGKNSSGPRLTYLEPQGKTKTRTLESLRPSVLDAGNGSSFYGSEASACSRSASRSSMSSIPAEYRTSPGGMPADIISSSVHSTWLVTDAGPTTVST